MIIESLGVALKTDYRVGSAFDMDGINETDALRIGGHHDRMRTFTGTEKSDAF